MKRLPLALAVALFLCSDVAFGCLCSSPWDDKPDDTAEQSRSKVKGALGSVSYVFAAEVVEIDKLDPNVLKMPLDLMALEISRLRIRLKIEKVWKGDLPEEIIIPAGSIKLPNGSTWRAGCDYTLEEGKKYLLYAYGPQDKIRIILCSRTKLLDKAEKDVEILNELLPLNEKARGLLMPVDLLFPTRNLTTHSTRPRVSMTLIVNLSVSALCALRVNSNVRRRN